MVELKRFERQHDLNVLCSFDQLNKKKKEKKKNPIKYAWAKTNALNPNNNIKNVWTNLTKIKLSYKRYLFAINKQILYDNKTNNNSNNEKYD